jgi:hypothetical protein
MAIVSSPINRPHKVPEPLISPGARSMKNRVASDSEASEPKPTGDGRFGERRLDPSGVLTRTSAPMGDYRRHRPICFGTPCCGGHGDPSLVHPSVRSDYGRAVAVA